MTLENHMAGVGREVLARCCLRAWEWIRGGWRAACRGWCAATSRGALAGADDGDGDARCGRGPAGEVDREGWGVAMGGCHAGVGRIGLSTLETNVGDMVQV